MMLDKDRLCDIRFELEQVRRSPFTLRGDGTMYRNNEPTSPYMALSQLEKLIVDAFDLLWFAETNMPEEKGE